MLGCRLLWIVGIFVRSLEMLSEDHVRSLNLFLWLFILKLLIFRQDSGEGEVLIDDDLQQKIEPSRFLFAGFQHQFSRIIHLFEEIPNSASTSSSSL